MPINLRANTVYIDNKKGRYVNIFLSQNFKYYNKVDFNTKLLVMS